MRPDVSRRKAYTAAARQITTIELAAAVATPGAFNPTLYDPQMVTAGCGVPIKVGSEVIGGIGVGGAPAGEKKGRPKERPSLSVARLDHFAGASVRRSRRPVRRRNCQSDNPCRMRDSGTAKAGVITVG